MCKSNKLFWVVTLLLYSVFACQADNDISTQPPPPDSATPEQLQALSIVNEIRTIANVSQIELVESINDAAQEHATYFVTNPEAYQTGLSPHNEDPEFPRNFRGVNFFDRLEAAGFSGSPFFEVMAFSNDPEQAVALWLNSVFHRVPLVHPNVIQMGYGGASGENGFADVIDFASGAGDDIAQIVLFPPPDATEVINSFDIRTEGPTPPAPPSGGNITGPIISILFDNVVQANISIHEIRNRDNELLAHTLVSPETPGVGPFMAGSFALYTDGPVASQETFFVHIEGTINGQSFVRDWSFITK